MHAEKHVLPKPDPEESDQEVISCLISQDCVSVQRCGVQSSLIPLTCSVFLVFSILPGGQGLALPQFTPRQRTSLGVLDASGQGTCWLDKILKPQTQDTMNGMALAEAQPWGSQEIVNTVYLVLMVLTC